MGVLRVGGLLGLGVRFDGGVGSIGDGGVVRYGLEEASGFDSAGEGVVHVRAMVNDEAVSGGWATLGVVRDGEGLPLVWWGLDLGAGEVFVRGRAEAGSGVLDGVGWGGGDGLRVGYPKAMGWQCVEVKVDADALVGQVWLNGLPMGSVVIGDRVVGASGNGYVRTVEVGAVEGNLTAGDGEAEPVIYLAEVGLATSYVGPVVVEPTRATMDDPARWVVLYDRASADSVAWAAKYRAMRGLPYANMIGLLVESEDLISQAAYEWMALQLDEYLSRNGLVGQVGGVLVGHGVPGRVLADAGYVVPVSCLLQRPGGGINIVDRGLAFDAEAFERFDLAAMQGDRMTARIDGPDLAASEAMLDRAAALEAVDLTQAAVGDSEEGQMIDLEGAAFRYAFDLSDSRFNLAYTQSLVDWVDSLDAGRLRVPMVSGLDEQDALLTMVDDELFWVGMLPEDFESVGDGGLWAGLSEHRVNVRELAGGAGGNDGGQRLRAFALPLVRDESLRYLRQDWVTSLPTSWVTAGLAAGYAAVLARYAYTGFNNTTDVGVLFGAARRGWTLAEAVYVAHDYVAERVELVGDPLLRLDSVLPLAGWDVYGPMEVDGGLKGFELAASLGDETVKDGLRVGVLPAWEVGGAIFDRPLNGGNGSGGDGVWLVRRVDALGREVLPGGAVVVDEVDGVGSELVEVMVPPVWPRGEDGGDGFGVEFIEGGVRLRLVWRHGFEVSRLRRVALMERVVLVSGVEEAVEVWAAERGAGRMRSGYSVVRERAAWLGERVQWAWRYWDDGGVMRETGWSVVV